MVITIIGMLAALLMPAINNAREAGRQATCINNQRQYSTALQTYLTSREYFPGYRMTLRENRTLPAVYPSVSWQVALLPQLQRNDLFQTWQAYTDAYANNTLLEPSRPYMEVAVCPSDNTAVGRSSPWTSYVVNSGTLDRQDSANSSEHRLTLPDTFQNQPMGVFQNHFGPVANRIRLTLTDIRDGQATTLMLSENLDANLYAYRTPLNPSPKDDFDNSERGTSFLHWWLLPQETIQYPILPVQSTPPQPAAAINGQKGDWDMATLGWPPVYNPPPRLPTGNGERHYSARPSSNHPGGVIVTFVGGNTQFLRDDINYDIYCLLLTPAGSRFKLNLASTPAPAPEPEPALNEGSFK